MGAPRHRRDGANALNGREATLVAFILESDRVYVAITAAVLAILLASVFLLR